MRITCLVVGLTLAISTPAVAQYDYAKQGLKITVANDGGITVTDARTGKTLPCIVTRTGDQKPAVVRVIEIDGSTVREFTVDTAPGNVVRVPGLVPPEEDDARKELDKQ